MKVEKIVEPVVPVEPVVHYNVQLSAQEAKMLKLFCGRFSRNMIESLLSTYPYGDVSDLTDLVDIVRHGLYRKLHDLGVPNARN